MKIYLGQEQMEVELSVYDAVNEDDVYIEAHDGETMLEGITIPKREWDNRLDALKLIQNSLEKRFSNQESRITKPKTYEEFVAWCESENYVEGSMEANLKLREFSADVNDFFE